MAQKTEERGVTTGLVVGAIGGSAFTAIIATLLAAKPVQAAPTDEKLDYLIEVLTTLVPVLAEVSERQGALIDLLQKWLAAQGVPGVPGIEVTVLTPWVGKEPQLIFQQAIRAAGNSQSDDLVDYRNAKRVVFKVESSLNQAVIVQLVGNITKSFNLATNVNGAFPCPANGNISIGLAWDDWQPYIGVIITAAPPPATPTAGILTIWAVEQE
jgi:hypothetical protein